MSDSVTTLQHSLSPVLKPFGWLYGRIMCVREKLFTWGLKSSWTPSVPTVSVGNIGWGGTGKTPVAGWLLGWAETKGLKTVLLTRGYRAKPKSLPYVVQPGALPEEAGDEPLMLARSHENAHVIVDPNRVRAGEMAEEKIKPDLIILDDGFQHMAVKRHMNLVLLRPEDVRGGWGKVIPAGTWREPVSALKRADAFMIKTGPKGFKALRPYLDDRLELFFKPVFSFQIMPSGVRRVVGGNTARDFDGEPYMLVSGVGEPGQVRDTAVAYFGYPPVRHMIYRDHYAYTKSDVLHLAESARKAGCKAILCTPKDAVKIGAMCTEEFWQFDLHVKFGPSSLGKDITFDSWWNRRFENIKGQYAGHGGGHE